MKTASPVYYINSKNYHASQELGCRLSSLMRPLSGIKEPPVILCIGTDRVTGDSLGPFVGTFLAAYTTSRDLPVYGCLSRHQKTFRLYYPWPRQPKTRCRRSEKSHCHRRYLYHRYYQHCCTRGPDSSAEHQDLCCSQLGLLHCPWDPLCLQPCSAGGCLSRWSFFCQGRTAYRITLPRKPIPLRDTRQNCLQCNSSL